MNDRPPPRHHQRRCPSHSPFIGAQLALLLAVPCVTTHASMRTPENFVPVEALDPYLEYRAIPLLQSDTGGQTGPQSAIFVTALDPTNPRKQVFISSALPGSSHYGFDAATGARLPGFSPMIPTGNSSTGAFLTAVPTRPAGEAVLGAPALHPHSLFEHHGTGTTTAGTLALLRMLDPQGNVLWTAFPTNTTFGPLPFPATAFGTMSTDSNEAALFLDEENYRAIVRSPLDGHMVWNAIDPYSQQINAAAVTDIEPGANDPAFVFCRGRAGCLLEKRRIKDGTLLWQSDLGSAHIFNFIAVGDLDGIPGDEVVAVPRAPQSPSHALVYVLDGRTGGLRWMHELGEATGGWVAAPALADLDGDALPEIIVQTETRLHAVKFLHGELPGWPVVRSTVTSYPMRAQAVVGDLDGDDDMEIVVMSKDSFIGVASALDIFDARGRREYFTASVSFNAGRGLTPAIADVDADGHNELLIGSTHGYGSELMPALWTLDFSRGSTAVKHGAILWGQYGADAQHRARALSPTPTIAYGPRSLAAAALPQATARARLAIANGGARTLAWSLSGDTRCDGRPIPPWLRPALTAGEVPGGRDLVIDIEFDATGLAPGPHETVLCLASNDAVYGVVDLPVRFDVTTTSYAVTVQRNRGGKVLPAAPGIHAAGAQPRYRVEPNATYVALGVHGCPGTLIANEFVLAPLTADCTMAVEFHSDDAIFTDDFNDTDA